jgi:hypothetical protein
MAFCLIPLTSRLYYGTLARRGQDRLPNPTIGGFYKAIASIGSGLVWQALFMKPKAPP